MYNRGVEEFHASTIFYLMTILKRLIKIVILIPKVFT